MKKLSRVQKYVQTNNFINNRVVQINERKEYPNGIAIVKVEILGVAVVEFIQDKNTYDYAISRYGNVYAGSNLPYTQLVKKVKTQKELIMLLEKELARVLVLDEERKSVAATFTREPKETSQYKVVYQTTEKTDSKSVYCDSIEPVNSRLKTYIDANTRMGGDGVYYLEVIDLKSGETVYMVADSVEMYRDEKIIDVVVDIKQSHTPVEKFEIQDYYIYNLQNGCKRFKSVEDLKNNLALYENNGVSYTAIGIGFKNNNYESDVDIICRSKDCVESRWSNDYKQVSTTKNHTKTIEDALCGVYDILCGVDEIKEEENKNQKQEKKKMKKKSILNKVAAAIVTFGLMTGGHIMGKMATNEVQAEETQKEVIAHQVASDGEVQVTYTDGSSETFQAVDGEYKKAEPQKEEEQEQVIIVPTEEELEKMHHIECMCDECIPGDELYDVYVESAEIQEDGDWILVLVDGSTVRINQELKEYELYTKELGDWATSFDTEKQLIMGIQTYIELSGDFK